MKDVLCPLERLGEPELNSWHDGLVAANGELTDAQYDKIEAAIDICAEDNGWGDADALAAFEFNVSIISGAALEEKLTGLGVKIIEYEALLDGKSTEELHEIIKDSENSAILRQAAGMLVSEMGDKWTQEMSDNLGRYFAHLAESRLAARRFAEAAT
ncbi:hypothetical protein DXH95_09055 [Sphingorhabdus pulchriflava]|uniref:Uncharacterized protein n=1 Tax=Sphingorhabdus pulchriflava TaxID=2292257 RepID=A0A371BIP4_9SPHN|nr:hypothetical protein [Sphingorhabdus pulchriflava]RDV07472.1 hypothetical protein DXH95_09055 [Sphingorhabdus pulchriflava]